MLLAQACICPSTKVKGLDYLMAQPSGLPTDFPLFVDAAWSGGG